MHRFIKANEPKIVALQVVAVAVIGLISAWYVPLTIFARHSHIFTLARHHLEVSHDWNALVILLGVFLVFLAYYLYQRKHVAYQLTIVTLVCLAIAHSQRGASPLIVLPIILAALWLYQSRSLYMVCSSGMHIFSSICIGAILVAFALCFGAVGLSVAAHGALPVGQSFINSFMLMSGSTISSLPYRHPDTLEYITHVLYIFDISAFLVVLIGLFKPIKFAFSEDDQQRYEMEKLIDRYGTSSEDYLKIYPHDKKYFINEQRTAAVAYGLIGSSVIILGGPVGKETAKAPLIKDFVKFCQESGWRIAAINIDAADMNLYKKNGLKNNIFVGSEAIVNIKQFAEDTIHSKHFRYIQNRAKRNGLTIEFWEHPNDGQIDELQTVSKAWASVRGRRDYKFFMGPFSRDYIRNCVVAVVKQNEKVIAYANLLPHNDAVKTSSIDHMRSLPNSDSSAMHFLLAQTILHEQAAGQHFFTLGFTPLERGHNESEKMKGPLYYARRLGSRIYSFEGLSQFKNKFEPAWQPQYVAYSGPAAQYLAVLNDVATIGSTDTRLKIRIKIIATLAVLLIALLYVLSS